MLKKSLLRFGPCASLSLLRLGTGPSPPGSAFAGTTVHWTVLFIRLTQLRLQARGSPSVANPLSGTIHALRSPCFAVAPAQAVRGLGVRRGEGPPDLHFIIASPTGPLSWSASPVDLWLEEWYRRPTGQGLFLQSFCIPTIHGGQMSEGTTPGKEEVELRQEQQPRATQE